MIGEHDGELGPSEHELADRLSQERPVPAAGFRGALARYLSDHDPGHGPRPRRLHSLVVTYLCGGSALLACGALVAVGAL
jgi:hypothetical protein